uniref:Uncharacterized protein n=1 Tax=Arundo donax TaxID=35708 RepID=A0A0A8ZLM3_ARUDO
MYNDTQLPKNYFKVVILWRLSKEITICQQTSLYCLKLITSLTSSLRLVTVNTTSQVQLVSVKNK